MSKMVSNEKVKLILKDFPEELSDIHAIVSKTRYLVNTSYAGEMPGLIINLEKLLQRLPTKPIKENTSKGGFVNV